MGHSPFCLLPDFRPRRGVMGIRVIRIIELIQQFTFTPLCHLKGQIASPFHAQLFRHENQFCTIGTHRSAALLAHVVRHQQLHVIAFQRGNHRQRNTRISTGRFDQHIAGLYFAALFSLDNHRQRRAIFHGTRRIIAFKFDPDFTAVGWPHALQFDQRGIADGLL
ncbi:hypothetical protein D3C80_1142870 [compost metagenome]